MNLIVGLGNPGKEYEKTRHNIGFMLLDFILNSNNFSNGKKALEYKDINTNTFIIKPLTYMNLSGESVILYKKYYNISADRILVIHDDKDMELGKIKIVFNSSSGGHNGIKNIENHLQTKEYYQLKIGIGHSNHDNTPDFVLSRFSNEELKLLNEKFDLLKNIIADFSQLPYNKLTAKYNNK